MRAVWSGGRFGLAMALGFASMACSVIVDSELSSKGSGEDAGMTGETCTFDAQCISFDPFNCFRTCVDGRCQNGNMAPDGTRCGMGANQHCIAGECTMRRCGDGFVDRFASPPEFCDDGNDNDADTCNNMCARSCAAPAPAICSDDEPCNGAETCMTGPMATLCRVAEPPADGVACMTADGADGTCTDQVCVPN